MNPFAVWEPVEVPIGSCASWTLEGLSVWVERYEKEWHLLSLVQPEAEGAVYFSLRDKTEKPLSAEWTHHLLRKGNWAIPEPVVPNRPVIIRPDRVMVLPPGEKVRFFISLPLSFRLSVGTAIKGRLNPLYLHPITPMPGAWFGDPVSGELCYFTEARLYSDFSQILRSPIHGVCPLLIINEADKELQFDRICLYTEFLGVYRSPDRFWTNEVNVRFRGPEQVSQVMPSKHSPRFEGTARLVSEPRQRVENWYFKRTFNLLKYFTGF